MVKVTQMTNKEFEQCSSCLKSNEETVVYKVETGKTSQCVSAIKLCKECLNELGEQITLIMDNEDLFTVRVIEFQDLEAVKELDELSGNGVYDTIKDYEEEVADYEYAWGAFLNGELIGYCTLGGADEYDDAKDGDLCLSDVFIKEEYRGNGYGTALVEESLKQHSESGNVFADLLDSNLMYFYGPLGFEGLDEFYSTIYLKRI